MACLAASLHSVSVVFLAGALASSLVRTSNVYTAWSRALLLEVEVTPSTTSVAFTAASASSVTAGSCRFQLAATFVIAIALRVAGLAIAVPRGVAPRVHSPKKAAKLSWRRTVSSKAPDKLVTRHMEKVFHTLLPNVLPSVMS